MINDILFIVFIKVKEETMKVKQLTQIALMASIEVCIFTIFSNILYLEAITFTVFLFAMVFSFKEAILSSLIFALCLLLVLGVTPWNLMYLLIYPSYSFIIHLLKKWLINSFYFRVFIVGFLSFLTGQLMQIPFMLVSSKVGLLYILLGLKTSFFQGIISALLCLFLFDSCYKILKKVKRGN